MGLVEVLEPPAAPAALRARAAASACSPGGRTCSSASTRRTSTCALERKLKRAGVRTVHYVSPSVWAWREGRAAQHRPQRRPRAVPVPDGAADLRAPRRRCALRRPSAGRRLPLRTRSRRARGARWDCRPTRRVLALLPGSRARRDRAARRRSSSTPRRTSLQRGPGLRVVAPMANARCRAQFEALARGARGTRLAPTVDGRSSTARARGDGRRADVVLLASGTAALEAMLAKRPMVVGYSIAPLTHCSCARSADEDRALRPAERARRRTRSCRS